MESEMPKAPVEPEILHDSQAPFTQEGQVHDSQAPFTPEGQVAGDLAQPAGGKVESDERHHPEACPEPKAPIVSPDAAAISTAGD